MKTIYTLVIILCISISSFAQQGTLTITFTPAVQGKTISADYASLIKAKYAFNDYNGYWFINPHTNLHHIYISLNNKAGASSAFLSSGIEVNSTTNDFEVWEHPSPNNDSNFISFSKASYVLSLPPEYDRPNLGGTSNHNKPMQVHITTFTSSELEFTITGNAAYGDKSANNGDGKFMGYGTILVHGHFYRDGNYEKSPVYPGCNCDATIYAQRYDTEEGDARTASACEAIYLNRLFNTTKKALAPIYNMSFNGKGKATAGAVMLRQQGFIDVSNDVSERPDWPFEYNYKTIIHRGDAAKAFYINTNYGIEMDEMPGDDKMNAFNKGHDETVNTLKNAMQSMNLAEKQASIDSLGKLMQAKKITMQEYSDKVQAIMAPAMKTSDAATRNINQSNQGQPDMGQLNMESMMTVAITYNPPADYFVTLNKSLARADVQVLHTVAGAAYVLRAPAVKSGDNWDGNKCLVLLGNYAAPVIGGHDSYYTWAINAKPSYPAGGNRLLAHNIAISMVGGKDQIEKALASIDWAAFTQLIPQK